MMIEMSTGSGSLPLLQAAIVRPDAVRLRALSVSRHEPTVVGGHVRYYAVTSRSSSTSGFSYPRMRKAKVGTLPARRFLDRAADPAPVFIFSGAPEEPARLLR
jgi:hypothetical protein